MNRLLKPFSIYSCW